MKARSEQVPTPYLSDPLDIMNIMRARKEAEEKARKEKEEEERIRREKEEAERLRLEQLELEKKAKKGKRKVKAPVPITPPTPEPPLEGEALLKANLSFDEDDQQKKLGDESCQTIISTFPGQEGPTENLAARLRDLKDSVVQDTQTGYLNAKETYNPYFYVDPKINRLQAAKNMVELFRIAEEIIMGDAFIEVEENLEEEYVDEVEEPEEL